MLYFPFILFWVLMLKIWKPSLAFVEHRDVIQNVILRLVRCFYAQLQENILFTYDSALIAL
jgi:hypothetical protein